MSDTAGRDELELAGLIAANAEALKHHPGQAQLIPQFREVYLMRLLEHLVGDALPQIKLVHERWVNDALGELGKQMRTATLLRPAPESNGRYTGPKQ
jgi:hypothetical protein